LCDLNQAGRLALANEERENHLRFARSRRERRELGNSSGREGWVASARTLRFSAAKSLRIIKDAWPPGRRLPPSRAQTRSCRSTGVGTPPTYTRHPQQGCDLKNIEIQLRHEDNPSSSFLAGGRTGAVDEAPRADQAACRSRKANDNQVLVRFDRTFVGASLNIVPALEHMAA
jgi:hypothetical protein